MQSVVQPEGFIYNNDKPVTVPTNQAELEEVKRRYGAVPLRAGKKYLFFTNPLGGFDPDLHYVTGDIGFPARFILSEDGTATPDSPIEEANQLYPPRSVTDLLREIEMLAREP